MSGVTFSRVEGPGPSQGGNGAAGSVSIGVSTIGGVSGNTTLTLPHNVTPGVDRAFLIFNYGRDPTGAQKGAEVTNLAINGENFTNTFQIASAASGAPGSFQVHAWLIRESDFSSFPSTGLEDFVFTMDDGTSQEFIAAIIDISDLSNTVAVSSNGGNGLIATPLVCPVDPILDNSVFLIAGVSAFTDFTLLTTPLSNNLEERLQGANTRMQILIPNGPHPLTDGQTQGATQINIGINVIMVPAS